MTTRGAAVGSALLVAASLVGASLLGASLLGAWRATPATATPALMAAAPAPVLDVAVIRADQAAVVTRAHQSALTGAQAGLTLAQTALRNDADAARAAQSASTTAATRAAAAQTRLSADRGVLADATLAFDRADAALASDRRRLGVIALNMYTGQIAAPHPMSLRQLELDQAAVLFAGEMQVVTTVVEGEMHADQTTVSEDARHRDMAAAAVGADGQAAADAAGSAAQAAGRVASATARLTADQQAQIQAQAILDAAQAALQADLAALAGPAGAPADGLSVLGGPALDADQLAAWYLSRGYIDMTAVPIRQLADWYLSFGAREGVRGDVAFAQAVLETGGFSSPDSVTFNNYAGIGHCDSCAAGLGFPDPLGGVVGQLQLLRIWSSPDPAPAGAPPPVLSILTPDHQFRRSCCPTWESLTGVWATDPTYGTQILGLYQDMLSQALPPRTDAAHS